MTQKEKVIEELAKVGYNRFYGGEHKWDGLGIHHELTRILWKDIAEAMLKRLEELQQEGER